jgi:hypothetical protein
LSAQFPPHGPPMAHVVVLRCLAGSAACAVMGHSASRCMKLTQQPQPVHVGSCPSRCLPWMLQIDWDYHMRLIQRGTPFLDPAAGSIIHFYHFRWGQRSCRQSLHTANALGCRPATERCTQDAAHHSARGTSAAAEASCLHVSRQTNVSAWRVYASVQQAPMCAASAHAVLHPSRPGTGD